MSLPNHVEQKSHDVINNKLSRVMKEVAEESMKMAAVEEYSSSPDNPLTVSGDGTWKTRGHSSLIDVKEMRKAIWAVWGHSCSTDDEPMHWFCPTNPNTWSIRWFWTTDIVLLNPRQGTKETPEQAHLS
ncbi:hypothetical protein TNCV_4903911 [Trichonephila clavipes]|nr:hypothetical protein TNCV_4903911 [Trichonephila clavipes]